MPFNNFQSGLIYRRVYRLFYIFFVVQSQVQFSSPKINISTTDLSSDYSPI